ncbi:E3 ubiquitin-protein ligase Hakai [Geodia barretti]|uniref:E3 ubiquitin-protein ligase Hakai n=2 Tax=Geodia barretti TaxID=519541 RepID=A0AA35W442_GEOBA|nr:E3 ubiquitin-protein ligase Hakai [Geodia barretti]
MEGVRRNIALKLKPAVGKDSGPHRSPGDGGRKKEGGKTSGVVEDVIGSSSPPPPPPPSDLQSRSPKPHPLPETDQPPTDHAHLVTSIPQPPEHVTMTTTVSVSGKVPPESALETGGSLRWDQKMNLLGRAVQDPLMHICEICCLPVLIYGRMKRCRHAFCRDCAKKAGGVCPRCREGEQMFEEASMGNVYICTHGGGRYDNKGCGRSYLSQRDLEAHITYRHKDKSTLPGPPPAGVALTSQSGLPSLPMPPFFAMGPAGLPPNFPLHTLPHPGIPPNLPGARGQPMFPARLPVVFVSQGATSTSAAVPTWTTPTVFKPL